MIKFFLEVLVICDEVGLIGKEMFAVDGCKLPSNASKEWSGARGDLENKAQGKVLVLGDGLLAAKPPYG